MQSKPATNNYLPQWHWNGATCIPWGSNVNSTTLDLCSLRVHSLSQLDPPKLSRQSQIHVPESRVPPFWQVWLQTESDKGKQNHTVHSSELLTMSVCHIGNILMLHAKCFVCCMQNASYVAHSPYYLRIIHSTVGRYITNTSERIMSPAGNHRPAITI